MSTRELRKKESQEHFEYIKTLTNHIDIKNYFNTIPLNIQLINLIIKGDMLHIITCHPHLPIKVQKLLIRCGYGYYNFDYPILVMREKYIQGIYCKVQFERIFTLKDRYKILKKKPMYTAHMKNDVRVQSITARYHPECYVSNWDFGYEMDILAISSAIKMDIKKRRHGLDKSKSIFKRLFRERKTAYPAIQFEYFFPHKYTFYNEDYDLSFQYHSFARCL